MLEARELSVAYGRHRALDRVSMRVARGEVCVVLGANGAGKSTLLNTIAGIVTPELGRVTVNDSELNGATPDQIVEKGVALVPEGHRVFGDLTVRENLQLGAYPRRAREHASATLDRVFEIFPKLRERQPQIAHTMSGGERQMVAIGRALMSRPDILMLDEPSLGLSPIVTSELFRALQDIGETGVGILLVEQNARKSLQIAERGYVLANGRVTHEDTARALAEDPGVREAYLGGASHHDVRVHAVAALPTAEDDGRGGTAAVALADRADRIHQAYLQSRRRRRLVGGAFGPRWESGVKDQQARELSGQARQFAERADRTLVTHLRARREKTPVPAAFDDAASAGIGSPGSPGGSGDPGRMAADFAAQAADIHQRHIAARRRQRSHD